MYSFFEEEYKRQQEGRAEEEEEAPTQSRFDRLRRSVRSIGRGVSFGGSIEMDGGGDSSDEEEGEGDGDAGDGEDKTLGIVQPYKNFRRKPSTVRYRRKKGDKQRLLQQQQQSAAAVAGDEEAAVKTRAFKEQQKATLPTPLTVTYSPLYMLFIFFIFVEKIRFLWMAHSELPPRTSSGPSMLC